MKTNVHFGDSRRISQTIEGQGGYNLLLYLAPKGSFCDRRPSPRVGVRTRVNRPTSASRLVESPRWVARIGFALAIKVKVTRTRNGGVANSRVRRPAAVGRTFCPSAGHDGGVGTVGVRGVEGDKGARLPRRGLRRALRRRIGKSSVDGPRPP